MTFIFNLVPSGYSGGAGGGMTLADLTTGAVATVVRIDGDGAFRRHLLELGLVSGTPVRRVGRAPLGDPYSFAVRGAVLTLRRREAARVVVEAS